MTDNDNAALATPPDPREVSLADRPIADLPITWKTLHAIAKTEFVPASLRGKVPAMLACVLTGREFGLGAMESMRLIDVIDGRPSPSGELQLRMIREKGHRVELVELTADTCTVRGIRGDGPDDVMEITFTREDAERAKLTGKSNWQNYPKHMLYWRAISMLASFQFPDAISGRLYTPDEMGSEDWAPPPDGEHVDEFTGEVIDITPTQSEQVVDAADSEVVEGTGVQPEIPSSDENGWGDQITAWSTLHGLLGNSQPERGTVEEIERRTRKLYDLMTAVELWGPDQLHANLQAWHGAEHWRDLKVKAVYQEFAIESFKAAHTTYDDYEEATRERKG